jgi:hypothetical protein
MENESKPQSSNLGHKGRGDLKAQRKRRWERIKSNPELHKAYLEKRRQRSLPKTPTAGVGS